MASVVDFSLTWAYLNSLIFHFSPSPPSIVVAILSRCSGCKSYPSSG